ncbi:MAG: excisionase family DNA binding protein [Kiritimatiellia bacterium]|jgi:excisionase family DNA binding protein
MNQPKLLTLPEVSAYLQIPEETIYKYARAGRIPASKIGRFWRFNVSDVDRWVNTHRNQVRGEQSILVIDDDPLIRNLMQQWLEPERCRVIAVGTGGLALEKVSEIKFDLAFVDLHMPDMSGVDIIRELRASDPGLQTVIITAHVEGPLMDQALSLGPFTILKKPFRKELIQQLVRQFAEVRTG